MIEREMEDLLWDHPEKFLNEPLQQFERQPASAVGRADLIFVDRIGRLLVIELKRDTLERGAVTQLVDYYGMLKARFPDKSVELMIVASRIPPERRIACEQFNIEAVEIPQKKFRDIADEIGYIFQSEVRSPSIVAVATSPVEATTGIVQPRRHEHLSQRPTKIEKAWYHWCGQNTRAYFLAFVNARESCSIRRFDAETGVFHGKEYRSGDFQIAYSDFLKLGTLLHTSRQPNLDRDCRERLPEPVLAELKEQISTSR